MNTKISAVFLAVLFSIMFLGMTSAYIKELSLSYPNGGEVVSGVVEIRFYANFDGFSAETISSSYKKGGCSGSSGWNSIGSKSISEDGDYVITWNTASLEDGSDYCVKITDQGNYDGLDEDKSNSLFTIDNIPDCTKKNWYQDLDNDGYGNPSVSQFVCLQPTGYVEDNTDCNDDNPNSWRTVRGYQDNDADGYTAGDGSLFCIGLNLPAGYIETKNPEDCSDNNPNAWVIVSGYIDNDGDDYGQGSINACTDGTLPSEGYSENNLDCDDTNILINPLAIETCDGIDNDCDASVDEETDSLCEDGIYCNGIESCVAGQCQQNTPIDCSPFSFLEIATCSWIPDNSPFTYDFRNAFTSVCDEELDSCVKGDDTIVHTCDVSQCGAECDALTSCADTDCDFKDGCYDNSATPADKGRYFDYNDYPNSCQEDCSCTDNVCGEFTTPYADEDNDGVDTQCGDQCDNDVSKLEPGICGCGITDVDTDNDLIYDCNDNCIFVANPDQLDDDADGIGNVCDNCPSVANPDQLDDDADGIGNVCDNYDCIQTNGGVEVCDEIDNNCDGVTDEGVTTTYYPDLDGDGFGFENRAEISILTIMGSVQSCSQPEGYSANNLDCNDNAYSLDNDCVAPVVILSSPLTGDYLNELQVPIRYTFTDDVTTSIECNIYVNGETSWGIGSTSGIEVVGGIGLSEDSEDGDYSIYVSCVDSSGNEGVSEEHLFTIDTLAPTIVLVNATDANTVEVVFDEELQDNEIHSPEISDFYIYNDSDGSLSFNDEEFIYEITNVVYSNKKVIITLNNTLGGADKPRLHVTSIPASLIDVAGNYFNQGNEYDTEINFVAPVTTPSTPSGGSSGGNSGGVGGKGIECITQWECSEWSLCVDGVQVRNCFYPEGFCVPLSPEPVESQSCNVPEIVPENEEEPEQQTLPTGGFLTGFVTGAGNVIRSPWGIGALAFTGIFLIAFLGIRFFRRR